jgi:hypothetical protein
MSSIDRVAVGAARNVPRPLKSNFQTVLACRGAAEQPPRLPAFGLTAPREVRRETRLGELLMVLKRCLRAFGRVLPAAILILASSRPVVCGKVKSAIKPRTVQFKLPIWSGGPGEGSEARLSASDLKITIGKSPVTVSALKGPESPALLFVAFDTVGDMANINEARKTVVEEIKALGSQFWAGLISAQEQMQVLQEPTADRTLLQEKIEELTQIGKAGLLESIQPIADLATGVLLNSGVRVAVIFITDSDIGNYRADYLNPPVNASDSRDLSRRFAGRALQEKISRMAALMARTQVPVFIVHIDPGLDPLNRSYHNGLKQLAEGSGGQCLLSKTSGDIPLTIHEAFQWAKSFYLAEFSLHREKSGYARIQISPAVSEDEETLAPRLIHPARIFVP